MIELAKIVHQAIGIESPRVFILVFMLFGALVFGCLGWLIDKGYRVSKPHAAAPNIHLEQNSSGPDSPNVATFGPNSPITLNRTSNPYVPVVWYEFNGVKHIQEGNSSTAILGAEMTIFEKLLDLRKERDWPTLRNVCEEQIKKSPEWLTPCLFAGVAYANLGDREQAIKRLEYVDKQAAGNSQYSDAARLLEVLRK